MTPVIILTMIFCFITASLIMMVKGDDDENVVLIRCLGVFSNVLLLFACIILLSGSYEGISKDNTSQKIDVIRQEEDK